MRAPTCEREEFSAKDIVPTIMTFIVVLVGLYLLSSTYLLLNGHKEMVIATDYNSVTTTDSGKMNVNNPELFEVGSKVLVGKSFVSNYSLGVFAGDNTSRYTIIHSTGLN